jgi:hypothetical protein
MTRPHEVFARLQDLWAQRTEAAKSAASPEASSKELINFGYWFTSEKFGSAGQSTHFWPRFDSKFALYIRSSVCHVLV